MFLLETYQECQLKLEFLLGNLEVSKLSRVHYPIWLLLCFNIVKVTDLNCFLAILMVCTFYLWSFSFLEYLEYCNPLCEVSGHPWVNLKKLINVYMVLLLSTYMIYTRLIFLCELLKQAISCIQLFEKLGRNLEEIKLFLLWLLWSILPLTIRQASSLSSSKSL